MVMKEKMTILDNHTPSSPSAHKILIVDDDEELRSNLSDILGSKGYHTDTASSGAEAIARATSNDYDIVLLDLMMPKSNGMDVLKQLHRKTPRTKVIMITAFASIDTAVEAMKQGACDYMSKPFKIHELDITIKKTLEEARFNLDVRQLGLDETFGSLSNYIRRDIIKLLHLHKGMRLMELTRALEIEDHTKVVFHLKVLRDSGIVIQEGKSYILTKEGRDVLNTLGLMENRIKLPDDV